MFSIFCAPAGNAASAALAARVFVKALRVITDVPFVVQDLARD
jgi:hypothetical protein